LYKQLSELWQKAGMYAHKWLSDSQAVIEQYGRNSRFREDINKEGSTPKKST